jgi:hypothetical protein
MIDIEVVSPAQAQELLANLHGPRHEEAASELTFLGLSIKGFFDVVCREGEKVAWEAHQTNLLTDFGRRAWMYNSIAQAGIFTSGVAETPSVGRNLLADAVGSSQTQVVTTAPTCDWNALTKTWSTTFGVPGSNRQIAIVGLLGSWSGAIGWGAYGILCYSALSPIKTQTTSQSLEISYRLTLSPGV